MCVSFWFNQELGGQDLAPLSATPCDDGSPGSGAHPGVKTMFVLALTVAVSLGNFHRQKLSNKAF
jgi:hypothetical protein